MVGAVVVQHNKKMATSKGFEGELHWELREPYGNLPNPTQMLSYNGMNNKPLHLANIEPLSSATISSQFTLNPTVTI